jgi:hypothetical protein
MKAVNIGTQSIAKRGELGESVTVLLSLVLLLPADGESVFELGDTGVGGGDSRFVRVDLFESGGEVCFECGKGAAEVFVSGGDSTELGASLREEKYGNVSG